MTEQNYYNNNKNIGLLSLKNDNIFLNHLNSNVASQLNNYNNLSPYIDPNLNINNLLYLNSNNQNMSNINLNNQISNNINNYNNKNTIYNYIQNNYYNKVNNIYYQSSNNINLIKPYFSNINMLIASHSLTKANDLIYKDLQQLENILSNYKLYIMNNNFDAIELCLKYILESNFFFNKVVTNKIENILKKLLNQINNNDENFKFKLKEVLKEMIPLNFKEHYLKEYFNPKGEKMLYSSFKKDLNLYKNYKDRIFYLYQIFGTAKFKLNNKDREEIQNIFKYNYGFNNQNFNKNNFVNNDFYNDFSLKNNGGSFQNNYNTYNNNFNYNNKYRKHSFQSNSNNWNESNYSYNNNININKNGNSNFNQYKSFNNNYNYIEDKNNDELGFNKIYDYHQNSSYHKKYNYKNNRHSFIDKNNAKIKNNRKNSGKGTLLVEVKTTPKKEENEIDDNNNKNIENKEVINDIKKSENDINKEFIDDNNINKNDTIKNENKENKDENNIILMNEINISQDMPKDEEQDNIKNNNENENENKENIILNEDENDEDKIDSNNGDDNNFNFQDDNIVTDFNSINPFNENNTKEQNKNEINSDKEDNENNLRAVRITSEDEKLNINKEEDIGNNNDLILNIINSSENEITNNNNLIKKDINEEVDNMTNNEKLDYLNININNEQENNNNNNNNNDNNNNNKDIEAKEQNIVDKEPIYNSSETNLLIQNNNKNDEFELKQKISPNLIENIKINLNSQNENMNIDINNNNNNKNDNWMNTDKNNSDNNLEFNINENSHQNNLINNNSLTNKKLLGKVDKNNSQINSNTNLSKTTLNNNILSNANNLTMNLMNNINSYMNLLNLFNEQNFLLTNNYYINENQNYINIFFNYLNQENNLISTIKPNSKNKNNHFNKQSDIDYLKLKSDKLSNEYNNKVRKMQDNNPLLVNEYKNLFEEKIILPLYQKICEENQLKKELYTDVYNKYVNVISKIFDKNNVKNAQIEPYGSIVNNFMIEYGDIDICIIPEDLNSISDFDAYLEEIKEEVVDEQKCAKFITLEKYSKFMIIKLQDIESEIDLDITVQNILPIINTKLIRFYSLYDQRFHILGIFMKFWVKKNQIHGALDKFLSSYALLILIIHYLQTITEPKVLPILQQIRNIKKDYTYHNGEKEILTNLYFEEDLEEIKKYMGIINCDEENESSIVDLLVGFFEYYAYKYNHYLISISRSDKVEVDANENIAFPLEDPFDIGYNPGKSMKLNTLQYYAFICCMKKELNNILSGKYFQYDNDE